MKNKYETLLGKHERKDHMEYPSIESKKWIQNITQETSTFATTWAIQAQKVKKKKSLLGKPKRQRQHGISKHKK